MFEELKEALTTPVLDGAEGWVILILLWIIVLFLAGLVVYGILAAINYWWLPIKSGYGTIAAMHFEAAHYSTIYHYNAVTKTNTPITTWHPDAWKLVIEVEGEQDDFYLTAEKYVNHKLGEQIYVEYSTGRLWKSVVIKSASV